jgi:hypothetical protein
LRAWTAWGEAKRMSSSGIAVMADVRVITHMMQVVTAAAHPGWRLLGC